MYSNNPFGIENQLWTKIVELCDSEIGEDILNGISYAVVTNNTAEDRRKIETYNKLYYTLASYGYKHGKVMRLCKTQNGCVYDLNPEVVGFAATQIQFDVHNKPSNVLRNNPIVQSQLGIYNKNRFETEYEKRRRQDLMQLGKWILKECKGCSPTGWNLEFVIFSRNESNQVKITGTSNCGENIQMQYKAYSLKCDDLDFLNDNLLIPMGLKIVQAVSHNIIQAKSGLRVTMQINSIEPVMRFTHRNR